MQISVKMANSQQVELNKNTEKGLLRNITGFDDSIIDRLTNAISPGSTNYMYVYLF